MTKVATRSSYGGWTFYQVVIVQTAASADCLMAAVTGKRIRLMGLVGTFNSAGTFQILNGSTALTGAISVAATGYAILPFLRHEDVNHMCHGETTAGAALNMTTVTGFMNGTAIVAVEN